MRTESITPSSMQSEVSTGVAKQRITRTSQPAAVAYRGEMIRIDRGEGGWTASTQRHDARGKLLAACAFWCPRRALAILLAKAFVDGNAAHSL
jgi:hypothetical protein